MSRAWFAFNENSGLAPPLIKSFGELTVDLHVAQTMLRRGAESIDALRADPTITQAALYDAQGRMFAAYPANLDPRLLPRGPADGSAGYQLDGLSATVFQPVTVDWTFRAGPLFANVVLLDEVNRASPRIQAALLEPMEEHQVTVDGDTRPLPAPFFCIATQNPFGQVGTFPLPESQLDRFALVLRMGWPDRAAEREILTGRGGSEALPDLKAVTTPEEVSEAVAAVRGVQVAPALVEYVLDLADATRQHPSLAVGASPRAALGLLHAARAHAVVAGRTYATPDDVQAVAVASFAHRVLLGDGADTAAAGVVLHEVIERVPVPRP